MGIGNRSALLLAAILFLFTVLGVEPSAWGETNKDTLERLERIIQQQQRQIDAQNKAIEALKLKVETLSGHTPAPSPVAVAEKPVEQPTDDEVSLKLYGQTSAPSRVAAAEAGKPVVRSGNDKVSLKLYGQVNRAALYANDGNSDSWYFVDSDHSSTRVGLLGSASPIEDISLGTRFEVEFQTNPSDEVSQRDKNQVGSNNFKKRHFDVFMESGRLGRLYLGYGSTASDGTSEVDLSGTDLIGYSSVSDMAGGQFFYDNERDLLSDTTVGNVFTNMDGEGRDDRLRYDSPDLYGLVASGSVISGDAADLALRYAAGIGSFKLAAAAAYSDPAGTSNRVEDRLNGSVSVLHRSGFNATFAGGREDLKDSNRDDATFLYGKFGYKRKFFRIGTTALAIDYGRFNDINDNNDEADTFGAMGVQKIDRWATEYYLGYRYHTLDRDDTDFDDINAFMTGLRVKF